MSKSSQQPPPHVLSKAGHPILPEFRVLLLQNAFQLASTCEAVIYIKKYIFGVCLFFFFGTKLLKLLELAKCQGNKGVLLGE